MVRSRLFASMVLAASFALTGCNNESSPSPDEGSMNRTSNTGYYDSTPAPAPAPTNPQPESPTRNP